MKTNHTSISRLLLAALVLIGASVAQAGVLLDTGTGDSYTNRGAGSGPGQGISVATDTLLTQIGFYMASPGGSDIKFMIWDGTNSNLLYSQIDYLASSWTPSLVLSDPFSFDLIAGNSYYFGIISDGNIEVDFLAPQLVLTENGLSTLLSGNTNYTSFSEPYLSGSGGATIALQLIGSTSSAVPEPGTMALFGLGLLAMFGAARRRKSSGIRAE